jgi:26S proteasome non-ATPase regulatory subunit 9
MSVVEEARKQLASLDVQRKALENEAQVIVSELEAPGENGGEPMGIDTPLTDRDGYPRADIDIYRTRTLRGRLAVIRTDHKALMAKIEEGLHKLNALQVSRLEIVNLLVV